MADLEGLREAATIAPTFVGAGPGPHVLEIQICGDWQPSVSTEHKEPSPEFGLCVHGVLAGKELHLLIDSGASVSILSSKVYHSLDRLKPELFGSSRERLVTTDGSSCEVEGSVVLKVAIGMEIFDLEFVVANVTDQAILGMPALSHLGCTLDFSRNSLMCRDIRIPCFDQSRIPVICNAVIRETVVVPPRLEFCVWSLAKVDDLVKGDFFVDPVESLIDKYGLVLAKSVVSPVDGSFVVRVCNPSEEKVVLYEGVSVGVLTPVQVVTDEDLDSRPESLGMLRKIDVKSVDSLQLPEYLEGLYSKATVAVAEAEKGLVKELLCKYQDVFSKDDRDLGRTSIVQHHIESGDNRPVT